MENHIYWTPESEQSGPTMSWWRTIVLVLNCAFAIWFSVLFVQFIFHFWPNIIPAAILPVLPWLSYHNKYKEFEESHHKGATPRLDMGHDFITLFLNLTIGVTLLVVILELSTELYDYLYYFWFILVFMTLATNLETLASTFAYILFTRRNKESIETPDKNS
ncbi:MAG: hypothetical protein ACFFE1_07930 [Candidatus Thorarchaeota archaeon]